MRVDLSYFFPQPQPPEQPFEQSMGQFSFSLPEPCLEARAITSPTMAAPVPKPRTIHPGKNPERRKSCEKERFVLHLFEESSLGPSQNSADAPRVPPRRKKSAPPDFHLQVLQSSNSLFLRGLTFNSNNNNHPSDYCSIIQDSDSLSCSSRESCFPARAVIASPANNDSACLRPTASSELIAGLQAPPLLDAQPQQQPCVNDFCMGSTGLLNLEADPAVHQSSPSPLPLSPTHSPKDLNLFSPREFSHWVTFEDGKNNTISQDLSELLAFQQNPNACVGSDSHLK